MTPSARAVQRNFHLPAKQAEWLREYAHRARRPQAEIVRDALAEYQARTETGANAATHDRNRGLMERFRQGRGIDLDVLRDEDGAMWSQDT
jgi:hypothetical protein